MNANIYTLLITIFLFLTGTGAFANEPSSPAADSPTVVIHVDPRIDQILTRPPIKYTGRARGFRVQIYSGTDRQQASQIKINFMRNHPGVRAYLTYTKPHFRVRVGDFPTRGAAAVLYRELSGRFSCMIVPSIIYIPPPEDRH